ncbi:MAG: DUF1697 domain-containing protein [Planctomycetes bacterium]|nr:DUF1697 domain-containing protein [Planctomycetota bacterium]
MRTHVALIRGINVGKAKRVAMADLRAELEALGYAHVATLLNSGNVAFTVPKGAKGDPAERIAAVLEKRLGVSARVTVLATAELDTALAANPHAKVAKDPSKLLVTVLASAAEAKRLAPFAKQDWKPEAFAVAGRCAYLWCPNGVLESRAWKAVERELADGATSRNWATMTKLLALARG